MRIPLLLLSLLTETLLLSSCGVAHESSAQAVRDDEKDVRFPSMVELLANPAAYEGSLIEVTGFYGGTYPALFLTRELAEVNDLDSAFLVTNETDGFIERACVGYYATIEGTFKRRLGGLRGPDPENFEIDDISQVSIFKDGKEITCWPPPGQGKR